MKKYYLLSIALLMVGCENRAMKKPFVIVNKYLNINRGYNTYWYQDVNGIEHSFESKTEYNIGDTLK